MGEYDYLLTRRVVPCSPSNPRDTDDPLDIDYRVNGCSKNHNEDIQLISATELTSASA